MDPTLPPRPCVNGTMAGSANGEEQEESGAGETMEGEAISESMEEQSGVGNTEEQMQGEEESN